MDGKIRNNSNSANEELNNIDTTVNCFWYETYYLLFLPFLDYQSYYLLHHCLHYQSTKRGKLTSEMYLPFLFRDIF